MSYDDADVNSPEFALLQAFGGMSDARKMRDFVAKAPDGVLLALAAEVSGPRGGGGGGDGRLTPRDLNI